MTQIDQWWDSQPQWGKWFIRIIYWLGVFRGLVAVLETFVAVSP